jgi:FkbM family methyltransferase
MKPATATGISYFGASPEFAVVPDVCPRSVSPFMIGMSGLMKSMVSPLETAAHGVITTVLKPAAVRRLTRELAMAGYLSREVWERLPVTDEFQVDLGGDASFRYAPLLGDRIGRGLYWRGMREWEAGTLVPFLALARTAGHFLDIGANTGVYTLMATAVNPALTAVAYEPVPRVFQRLQANLELNGVAGRCTVRGVAVADRASRARLHVPAVSLPSSASLSEQGFKGKAGELVEVDVVTVDQEQEGRPRVDLAKIDVEGFEDQVIEGMAKTIASDRPVIVCECNPDGPCARVERLMRSHGYGFVHLRAEAPVLMPGIVPDPSERDRNYLFVPAERQADVLARIGAAART